MWLQVIHKTNVTHQGQGQIKVISKGRQSYVGGLHLNQMDSFLVLSFKLTLI